MPENPHLDSFPVEEYEFGEGYVSDEEIDACYFYEFAREQSELIKGIKLWRTRVANLAEIKSDWLKERKKKQKDIFRRDPRIYPETDNDNADALMPKYLEKYPLYLSNLIAASPEFPDTPWRSIPSDERKIMWGKTFKVPTPNDFRKEPYRAIDDITVLIDACEKEGMSLKSLLQRNRDKRLNTEPRLLNICWNWDNKQIGAAFESWLAMNRPSWSREPTIEAILGKGRGIGQLGAEWTLLPHEKRTSLDALGVYRRKKLCNWREFLEQWPYGSGSERRYQAQKKIASETINSFFDL